MKRSLSLLVVGLFFALSFDSSFAADAKLSFEDHAASARFAMSKRDMAGAEESLDAAKPLAKTAAQKAELDRLEVLLNYLTQFWKAVRTGMARLNATSEVVIRGERCSVVEASSNHLIIRKAGQNLRYRTETLPNAVVMTLAERSMQQNNTAKIAVGAYLLIDKKGNRETARQLWTEAKKAGAKIDKLMPELEAEAASNKAMAAKFQNQAKQLADQVKTAKGIKAARDLAIDALNAAKQAVDAECLEEALALAEVALSAAKKSKNVPMLRQASMAIQQIQMAIRKQKK